MQPNSTNPLQPYNENEENETLFSAIHDDIITEHILPHLDGSSLASTICTCTSLRLLAINQSLWTRACATKWPSSSHPTLTSLISSMNGGPRSFFSDCFCFTPIGVRGAPSWTSHGSLVSAVDLRCNGGVIFSGVNETETGSGSFRCSPFRVDVVGGKERVRLGGGGELGEVVEGMRLSWVVVDTERRRGMDVSSGRAVEVVGRHWLTGEVEVVFSWVLVEWVEARVVVRCRGWEVVELSLLVEDLDGRQLSGEESMEVLKEVMGGGRSRGRREVEGRRRFVEFLEMKRRRKASKVEAEYLLDVVSLVVAILCIAVFFLFLFFR